MILTDKRSKTMWTRLCTRIVFLVIVVGTAWAQELDLELEWIRLDNGTPMHYVSVLEGADHRLYAGTSAGLLFSENGGNTWSPTTFGNEDEVITTFGNEDEVITTLTTDRNTVYVGTWRHGIFRSDDAGETWKPLNEGLRFQDVDGEHFYGTVRHILIIDNTIINVMYHGGTYISTDRGETWHDVSEEWYAGNSIYAITAFDGYLWTAISTNSMARSPDDGLTWQNLPFSQCDRTNDWAVLQGQLYVAGQKGVGRWSETLQTWEYPMDGLPIDNTEDSNDRPYVYSFAVRGGYLFAGLATHGVYAFDAHSETWSAMGLQGLSIDALLSYGDGLYVGTRDNGIYRAELPVIPPVSVQPHGRTVTTWAHLKQTTYRRD